MTIWLVLGAITVGVVAALLAPLFRRTDRWPSRTSREIAIYRDQLAELRREADIGRIQPAEAQLAEAEIRRKVLAAARSADPAEVTDAAPRHRPRLAAQMLIAAAVPAGALAAYLSVGSPGEPGHPFDPARAAAEAEAEQRAREMATLADRLAERLKTESNDLEGWRLLARTYGALQRTAEAARAYERVYELSGNDVRYAGDYAEALVAAAGAQVTPRAQALFERVVESHPSEPRARFYLALARAQAGKTREAIAMWRSLEIDSPPDAQWLPTVREMIATVAVEAGIDPESVPATSQAPVTPTPGPTEEDVAAAQSMNPEDQARMIEDMVAGLARRLEANPDDLDGWKRLGRSYLVLDDPERAKLAYGRAVALAPTDLALLGDYARATLLASGPATLPPQSIDALRQLMSNDGSHPTALWLVGLAEADAGNGQQAATLWRRLLPQLDPDTPAYRAVQARLAALASGN
jgi:cytochrome c-type biogenesis protein CcmH